MKIFFQHATTTTSNISCSFKPCSTKLLSSQISKILIEISQYHGKNQGRDSIREDSIMGRIKEKTVSEKRRSIEKEHVKSHFVGKRIKN